MIYLTKEMIRNLDSYSNLDEILNVISSLEQEFNLDELQKISEAACQEGACKDFAFWVVPFLYNLSKNVNHCFDCGICIEGYDHHCPWVSKCIGKNNLYSFYCFMTGILLNFAFAIICITTIE